MSPASATTICQLNPLRYRGYVYDTETELYYLQSRYYNPEIGRFINADELIATGQGFVGNNRFAYCGNNVVNYADPCGTCHHRVDFWNDCKGCKLKGKMEKQYDFSLEACKTIAKSYEYVDAFGKSLDCFVGVGLGMCGSVTFAEALKTSLGIAYDVIGLRLNDGKFSASQRSYMGVDAALYFPIISFSEEMYREISSDSLFIWETDPANNFPIVSLGMYPGLGASINISIDFEYLFREWDEISGRK